MKEIHIWCEVNKEPYLKSSANIVISFNHLECISSLGVCNLLTKNHNFTGGKQQLVVYW